MQALIPALMLLVGLVTGALAVSLFSRRARLAEADRAARTARAEAMAAVATLEERSAAQGRAIEAQRCQLELRGTEEMKLRGELASAREALARLETELSKEREQATEKLAFLESARATLVTQFQALANEILEEKSQRFSVQHRSELDLLLKPLGEKLQAFEKTVQDTYVNEAKERFSLAEEVRKLQAANLQISQEAVNLTRALKGESKTRGNWGEVILERVLERSGLEKGREYETQFTLEGDGGAKLRPDVIVRLPDEKHIVIDSKVSLLAYDRYYSAEGDAERELALGEHIASMRSHIDALAEKNYQGRAALNTPDFVAMFVPIEPAFSLAAHGDATLYLDAFDKKVVIVTPATLLAMLSTVSTLWRRELQTQNVLEIARRSGELYDKFVLFVEALRDIGVKLGQAQESYDRALNRLSEGRGNLVRRVEDLKRLGARAEKSLPADLISELDNETDLPGDDPVDDPQGATLAAVPSSIEGQSDWIEKAEAPETGVTGVTPFTPRARGAS